MLQALLGNGRVPCGPDFVGHGAFDLIQMQLDGRAGGLRIARLDGCVEAAMLGQQHVAGQAVLEHDVPIVKHALPQIIHRSHHVPHDDIMAGLDDGHVKAGVQGRFVGRVALLVGGRHFAKQGVDHLKIDGAAVLVRAFGGKPSMSRQKSMSFKMPAFGMAVRSPRSCSLATASRWLGGETPNRSARSIA